MNPMIVWQAVKLFASKVPWQVWAAAGLVVVGVLVEHRGHSRGVRERDAYWSPIVDARDATIADQTAKALKAKLEAQSLSNTLKAVVKQIGDDRAKAKAELDAYRRAHPVHIWMCEHPAQGAGSGAVPRDPGAAAGAGEAEGVLQSAPARDIGPALDALMAEADGVNEALRSCEVAYEAVRIAHPH